LKLYNFLTVQDTIIKANVSREKNFLKCILCGGSLRVAPQRAKYVEFSSTVNFEANFYGTRGAICEANVDHNTTSNRFAIVSYAIF